MNADDRREISQGEDIDLSMNCYVCGKKCLDEKNIVICSCGKRGDDLICNDCLQNEEKL